MIKILLTAGIAYSVFMLKAQAEYRVYQYLVKPKLTTSMATQIEARTMRSTMNPVTFLAYNGGSSHIDATLLRSWMCPGSTGKKDFCPHPSERVSP